MFDLYFFSVQLCFLYAALFRTPPPTTLRATATNHRLNPQAENQAPSHSPYSALNQREAPPGCQRQGREGQKKARGLEKVQFCLKMLVEFVVKYCTSLFKCGKRCFGVVFRQDSIYVSPLFYTRTFLGPPSPPSQQPLSFSPNRPHPLSLSHVIWREGRP